MESENKYLIFLVWLDSMLLNHLRVFLFSFFQLSVSDFMEIVRMTCYQFDFVSLLVLWKLKFQKIVRQSSNF
jgi:hypothetical protein